MNIYLELTLNAAVTASVILIFFQIKSWRMLEKKFDSDYGNLVRKICPDFDCKLVQLELRQIWAMKMLMPYFNDDDFLKEATKHFIRVPDTNYNVKVEVYNTCGSTYIKIQKGINKPTTVLSLKLLE